MNELSIPSIEEGREAIKSAVAQQSQGVGFSINEPLLIKGYVFKVQSIRERKKMLVLKCLGRATPEIERLVEHPVKV